MVLRDGRVLVVKFKKDNKVILLDLVTNFEKTLYEGDEDVKLIKLREQELVLMKPKSMSFFRLPIS